MGGAAAAHAPVAAEAAAAVALVAAGPDDAEEEEDGGEEEEDPRGPGEAVGVGADVCTAAGVAETVSGFDEDGTEERGENISKCRIPEKGGGDNIRHEDCCNGGKEEGDEGDEGGDGGPETAAAGQKGGEEGERLEEEGDEEKGPAEAPHVVVVERGGVAAVAADEAGGDAAGPAVPGLAEGRGGTGVAAVVVVAAAEEEVGPLGHVAGAGDARGVGAEEVGLAERGAIGDAGEDDEPEEHEGGGVEEEGSGAQDGVCGGVSLVVDFPGCIGWASLLFAMVMVVCYPPRLCALGL